jgi:hypothetical protein
MPGTLYQQINLYQPIFRKQRQIFSAVTMMQAVAIVTVALVAIYVYGLLGVLGLEAEAVQLEGREKAFATQLATLDPDSGQQRRREVEGELKRLNETLVDQQKLIEVLREQPLGSTEGFSAYLAALARRNLDGLWLTRVKVNGATDAIELVGKSVDPELVPRYLLRLGQEEALVGQRFDRFQIERQPDDPRVDFKVSSRRANETAFERELASR